jgi:hypothetical protein
MPRISRRKFVKTSLATGAAISAFPTIFVPKSHAAWERKSSVHPNIEDLRVVGITEPKMTRGIEPVSSWERQNEMVDADAVWESIDKLASGLADTRNPDDAWRAIFIKPPRKSWSSTVVAIKTNNIRIQHTRSAVMAKICHALVDTLGVRSSNIHIYDAIHGDSLSADTPFSGLPDGCRIEDDWGGITSPVAVPAPWKGEGGSSKCLGHLADGSVDILINIAMCKGHSTRFGGFTMTMKNHLGTFAPRPAHWLGSQDYLMAINQTPEILGAMDKRTGKVLYPRQQLCLVDALWASKRGPGGMPSHQPNFIAMGVFSPAVDYLLATRFRGDKMGWKPNMEATRRMLTEFGYQESDLPNDGQIVEVS